MIYQDRGDALMNDRSWSVIMSVQNDEIETSASCDNGQINESIENMKDETNDEKLEISDSGNKDNKDEISIEDVVELGNEETMTKSSSSSGKSGILQAASQSAQPHPLS